MTTVAAPAPSGKYRKLPALTWTTHADGSQAGQEGKCARITGHTLIVKGSHIECQSCGATWRDQGF